MRLKRWMGFRSVLCPIDFSEQSRLALRYAEAIASRGGAVLQVVHAGDPLLVAAAAAALQDRHMAKRSAKELDDFVESTLATRSKTGLAVTARVSIGEPADEIVKAAGRHRSDLIVMGTHGLTGTARLIMGSTTLAVLQRTTLPVLAVPGAGERRVPRSWPGERIVAAVELDDEADRDVEIAAHLARWFDASLLLLHVVNEITRPDWLRGDLSAHDRIRVGRAQRRLDSLAADVPPEVTAASRVICGGIAREIAAFVATERTGLLITPLHERRGWFGTRRGSIAYHVLTQAVSPVLAYPPRWRPR